MQQVEVIQAVEGSLQETWDVYTDHAGWKNWSGLRHSSLEKEGAEDRNGAGAVRSLGSYGFNAFEEILDFNPPERMTYRVVKGGLPMKNHLGEVLFEPDGPGTRVTWRCRFDSGIPGTGWFMRLYVAWFFRSALEGFAAHMQCRRGE
jgi:hypothetical protein